MEHRQLKRACTARAENNGGTPPALIQHDFDRAIQRTISSTIGRTFREQQPTHHFGMTTDTGMHIRANTDNGTHHRVGTVDVPSKESRKPDFGECDGYRIVYVA
ncbi:hypothetical protein N9N28_01625 [Rubripirellula amarantea]|nr:hypothetical protein [Rubripirellula amarantea]